MQTITDLAWLLMRVNMDHTQGMLMSCMGQLMHAMRILQHVRTMQSSSAYIRLSICSFPKCISRLDQNS